MVAVGELAVDDAFERARVRGGDVVERAVARGGEREDGFLAALRNLTHRETGVVPRAHLQGFGQAQGVATRGETSVGGLGVVPRGALHDASAVREDVLHLESHAGREDGGELVAHRLLRRDENLLGGGADHLGDGAFPSLSPRLRHFEAHDGLLGEVPLLEDLLLLPAKLDLRKLLRAAERLEQIGHARGRRNLHQKTHRPKTNVHVAHHATPLERTNRDDRAPVAPLAAGAVDIRGFAQTRVRQLAKRVASDAIARLLRRDAGRDVVVPRVLPHADEEETVPEPVHGGGGVGDDAARDLGVEMLGHREAEIGLDGIRAVDEPDVRADRGSLGHDHRASLHVELRPPGATAHLQQRPALHLAVRPRAGVLPRAPNDAQKRGKVHAHGERRRAAEHGEDSPAKQLLAQVAIGVLERAGVESNPVRDGLRERLAAHARRRLGESASVRVVADKRMRSKRRRLGRQLLRRARRAVARVAEHQRGLTVVVRRHHFHEPIVEPALEEVVVLRGVVSQHLGLERHRSILLTETTRPFRRGRAKPSPHVVQVGHRRRTRGETNGTEGRGAHGGALAEHFEARDDRLESAPSLVAEEVDLVDHHEREVAEEGHAAAVFVLAGDAVELLGSGEDDVDVGELGPGGDVGVASELLAHDAEGTEPGDPLLLLLLDERLEGGHVDGLELTGAMLERAGVAIHALQEHLKDGELEEDRLAAAGGGAWAEGRDTAV